MQSSALCYTLALDKHIQANGTNFMLKRWAIAFGQLGLILLVIGIGPALAMSVFAPTANAMIPVLLSLTVAPLGALSLLAAAIMWVTGKLRD